jgi:sulfonate dioxygenase
VSVLFPQVNTVANRNPSNHIALGVDLQTRVRWAPRTVVLWDNRVTAHSAIVDFEAGDGRRHGSRITPQAEKPFLRKD